MTRPRFVATLAAGLLTIASAASAQSPDEKPMTDVLNAALNAEAEANFSQLVSLVHPQTQHLFRDLLSARFDILLRSYAFEKISAVSGLPGHPKDLALSDSEFFVLACASTKVRHPEFADFSKYFPFTIEGITFDSDQRAHIVLSWPMPVHTERTDFAFLGSAHVFLRREQSRWLLWSCPLAQNIGDIWYRDLSQLRDSQQCLR